MRRLDALRADAGVLLSLLRGMPRDVPHAQRLQAFYAPQAAHYDAFRERLLQGRQALIAGLVLPDRARVVELGGGTGRNLDFFGPDQWQRIAHFHLVDLCPALIERAQARAAADARIDLAQADATRWQPPRPADCVYFSYALTMIPDWRAAIDNALAMLKPGGLIAVVDFYVSPVRPAAGLRRHGAFARWFWPRWFGHDGVHPSAAHLPYLREQLPQHDLVEADAAVPYLPLLRVPYYRFVGRKPITD
ncbi:class I SAM-dependent methyltransferase [Tahibacter caeni]|uniref:class I SAM-dependent methyltransferase n=1 Tax=Tahibacter caeni TaxID=1453545 RepID=UPI0021491A12|nr:class I SAM-dependent methyltransferase [Tahibacter caeni]